jgi:hypothetical protein
MNPIPLLLGAALLGGIALTRKKLPAQPAPGQPGSLAPGSDPTHVVVPQPGGGAVIVPAQPGGGTVIPLGNLGSLANLGQIAGPGVVQPPPAPIPTPGVQHAMVTTHDTGPSGNLFIRSSPSVVGSSASASPNNILGSAPHGSIVAVTGPQTGLFLPVRVEASGLNGFAAAAFLTLV